MTIDPAELHGPQLPRPSTNNVARPLTVDQAYARAYGDMRRLCLAFAQSAVDLEVQRACRDAVEALTGRLERDLAELHYGNRLAAVLARPE